MKRDFEKVLYNSAEWVGAVGFVYSMIIYNVPLALLSMWTSGTGIGKLEKITKEERNYTPSTTNKFKPLTI
jgi:hypothetical protein